MTPIRIDVVNARITFGRWQHVVIMPNSTIVIDPATTIPHRLWSGLRTLNLTYSPAEVRKEALFDAFAYQAPEEFVPRFSGPVGFTATFTASRPGVTIDWAWSAAVYSQFGPVGTFLLKPLSGPLAEAHPQAGPPDLYANDDPAGTAEAYKQYVVAGAMGNGAPQYVGARSDTASVIACPTAPPPEPATENRPFIQLRYDGGGTFYGATPRFASRVTQSFAFIDGSMAQAVDRCFAFDLCARITYTDGTQLAIYSEGAAYCEPYVLNFIRSAGAREVYSVSRNVDHDPPGAFGCGHSRTTRIPIDAGRAVLTVSENLDGTLRFQFNAP